MMMSLSRQIQKTTGGGRTFLKCWINFDTSGFSFRMYLTISLSVGGFPPPFLSPLPLPLPCPSSRTFFPASLPPPLSAPDFLLLLLEPDADAGGELAEGDPDRERGLLEE